MCLVFDSPKQACMTSLFWVPSLLTESLWFRYVGRDPCWRLAWLGTCSALNVTQPDTYSYINVNSNIITSSCTTQTPALHQNEQHLIESDQNTCAFCGTHVAVELSVGGKHAGQYYVKVWGWCQTASPPMRGWIPVAVRALSHMREHSS